MSVVGNQTRVALISESFGASSERFEVRVFSNPAIPGAEQLRDYDVVLCVGPFASADRAAQLGGTLRLAAEDGATLVFAYNVRFRDADLAVLSSVLPPTMFETFPGTLAVVAEMPRPHPAFRRYLLEYGRGDQGFGDLSGEVEVLGEKVATDSPYSTNPCAFVAPAKSGVLYVVPAHLAGEPSPFVESLVDSVLAHRAGSDEIPPAYFSDLRLPGEDGLVAEIERLTAELSNGEQRVAELRRHKQLVGHLAGDPLEIVVIDALNVVLTGSDVEARNTLELREEDFEVVASGARIAIAESKAEAGGVSIASINQLNNPRTALDATTEELPGVLVVNQYRNDDDLGRRRDGLQDRLIKHARAQNVLVLRTWDLFQLVVRRLNGCDDSTEIRAAIEGGGGWLEVTDPSVTYHGPA